MRFFSVLLLVFLVGNELHFSAAKSVLKDRKKDQGKLDKEVLLEDEDYEDDVLNLEPEEQKERLKNLVEKKIDSNQDGRVDEKELKAWCVKAFDRFEVDDLNEEFPLIDTDKDGKISWPENCKDSFGQNYKENDPRIMNPDENDSDAMEIAKQYRKEKRLFKVADHNQDNLLDFNEYHNFKHPRRDKQLKLVLIQDKLQNSDKDKNNAIDLNEFLDDEKHSLEEGEKDDTDAEEERFRDELDKDDNGLLEEEEIVEWLDPSNEEEAHEEADHLMEECDTDSDKQLTLDEILSNHEIWVESDATDYGRHLMMNHDEF